MQIKLIVAGAAIALVAGVGSVSAGENFATLAGIAVQAITTQEMAVIRGAVFSVNTPGVADAGSGGQSMIGVVHAFGAAFNTPADTNPGRSVVTGL